MVVIMFWNSKKKLKILAFSGGAEMGEVSIRIAKALEDHLKKLDSQKNLIEYFDVVAGNSIGYIITSCLIVPSDKNPKKPKFTLDKCIKNFDKDLNSINSNINMWDKLSLILNSKNTTWNKFLLFSIKSMASKVLIRFFTSFMWCDLLYVSGTVYIWY